MWRHEDVFFGAMGGAGGGGTPITTPGGDRRALPASRARGACPPARSCTAPRTGWRSARCSPAARVDHPGRAPPRRARAVAARRARAGELHRDRRRRVRAPAARRARHARSGRALDVSSLRVAALGRRDPLAVAEARARRTAARRARRRRLRRVGDRRPGSVGRGRRAATSRPRRGSGSATTRWCSATTCGPARVGVVGRLARRGHIPLGYYKDPEKTAATFPVVDGVRWAVPGDHAVVDADGIDHAARPRFGVDQHRRREGVPRRGRVGAEGARRRVRRGRRRRARRALGRARRRGRAAAARRRARRSTRCSDHARAHLAGYKVPRDVVLVDAIERSPSGKPDYRWARSDRHSRRRVRSRRDRTASRGETSPYLRQHADNPVDWYPWGDEAFALARERDVPIFLSVGYSSCHWCHVMAHESFEDDATADADEPRCFVNVKVDREERPDVDAIYMQSVQALTGRGGWPMSVWCTPDGRPFYARHVLPRTTTATACRRSGACAKRSPRRGASGATKSREQSEQAHRRDRRGRAARRRGRRRARRRHPRARVRAASARSSSRSYGGFGRAPKFPQAMTIDFLCRAYVRNARRRDARR